MSEQVQKMDSFRLLLNEISHELTDENLNSLIHIYGVPGSKIKQINDGLALFGYMITQDFISREKIGNLHKLMRRVRPRRMDLVRLVEKYIKKEFQTNDIRTVLDELSESWEHVSEIKNESLVVHGETTVCRVDCGYFNCFCRRVPSCYTPIVLLLFLAVIATIVFWYAHVPKITDSIDSNSDLKTAGPYIIILEILALVILIGFCTWRKLATFLASRRQGYRVLSNPGIQAEAPKPPVDSNNTTRINIAPRTYKISEAESAAVFSNPSGGTGNMQIFGTFTSQDDIPDSGAEA